MSLRVHGNRLLKTLPGSLTRPTAARVRAAIFNIWQGRMEGCRWLDLCAGSGAMGAEALCRGATLVLGIEQSSRACTIIEQNWQKIAQPGQTFQIMRGNVQSQLIKLAGQQFDYIYLDPPYASEIYDPIIAAIARYQLLAHAGELAVEHAPQRLLNVDAPELERCREKQYGQTAITFFRAVLIT
jgi:16S rRNA (guanine(966)-N(2))-methyltransferase RsmD